MLNPPASEFISHRASGLLNPRPLLAAVGAYLSAQLCSVEAVLCKACALSLSAAVLLGLGHGIC